MLTQILVILALIIILNLTLDDVDFSQLDDYEKISLSAIIMGVFITAVAILL